MAKFLLALLLLVCISGAAKAQPAGGFLPVTFPASEIQGDNDSTCLNGQERESALESITSDVQTLIQESVVPFLAPGSLTPCMTGGRLVAFVNMSKDTHNCPGNWREITSPVRACVRGTIGGDCDSVNFSTGDLNYTRICGRVSSYQYCTTDAFNSYNDDDKIGLEDVYVDGVSITHGRNPMEHIWTFAAAYSEDYSGSSARICPCTNPNSTDAASILIPPFVGIDYFCDTGTLTQPSSSCGDETFYTANPLWDGEGCGPTSTCCELNNPPWFFKTLPQPTTDDIEVRICGSNTPDSEEAPVHLIELYVL